MTRLRSPAQRAPQTKAQALALLERFAARSAEIASIEADRQALLAAANAAADALLVPLAAELKDILKQLKPWWAASFDELTGGKRKSIELAGCVIGYRINPPKVSFVGGDEDAAVAALLGAELEALVRTKQSPDKPAILKLLDARRQALLIEAATADISDIGIDAGKAVEGAQLEELGFAIDQKEVFFVDAIAPVAGLADVCDRDVETVA